jgi:predicted ferric reductase
MEVLLSGIGGSFSCFQHNDNGSFNIPSHMLWIAGGVGITPFMSMWDGIVGLLTGKTDLTTDIVLVFSGREDDADLIKPFLQAQATVYENISITVMAYLTQSALQTEKQRDFSSLSEGHEEGTLHLFSRRLERDDFSSIDQLGERDVFLCGPQGLINSVKDGLKVQGVDFSRVHDESFFF